MKVAVIIPTYNLSRLQHRGWDRVRRSILSIGDTAKVIISDGSTVSPDRREAMNMQAYGAIVVQQADPEFNKPRLLNRAMSEIQSDWYLCSDADYLFPPGFIIDAAYHADVGKIVLNRVRMLPPNVNFTAEQIRTGNYGDVSVYPFNEYGELANGGCQLFHRSWFERCGGYDERMSGWGGMDNDMVNRAKLAGMEVEWLEGIHLLHQWHPVSKMRTREDRDRSMRNWKIRDSLKHVNWRDAI